MDRGKACANVRNKSTPASNLTSYNGKIIHQIPEKIIEWNPNNLSLARTTPRPSRKPQIIQTRTADGEGTMLLPHMVCSLQPALSHDPHPVGRASPERRGIRDCNRIPGHDPNPHALAYGHPEPWAGTES